MILSKFKAEQFVSLILLFSRGWQVSCCVSNCQCHIMHPIPMLSTDGSSLVLSNQTQHFNVLGKLWAYSYSR